MPFDRIVIGQEPYRRTLSVQDFFALPIHMRVECVLQREVEFWFEDTQVPRRDALKALRRAEAR